MAIPGFLAKQLLHPSGLFGRYVVVRFLNHQTSRHCSVVREELARVVRPGGRLVLGFMSPEDIVRAGLDRHGFSYHSSEELNAALVVAGFQPRSLRTGEDSRGRFFVVSAERLRT